MARILVVEDDATVAGVVVRYLAAAGHLVTAVGDGPAALTATAEQATDAVVLDLMLPGMDGIEVCRRLREHGDLPIVMLTARSGVDDRILGLEVGVDDYVSKPFSPRELVLRVEAVLRRTQRRRDSPATWVDGDLEIDTTGRVVRRQGIPVALTAREFDLLAYLAGHPGVAFDRATLLSEVWGWDFGDQTTVTVHVRRLREKVEVEPSSPRRLVTVRGTGYRWESAP